MQINPHKLALNSNEILIKHQEASVELAKQQSALAIEHAIWCKNDTTQKVIREIESQRGQLYDLISRGNATLSEIALRSLCKEAETLQCILNLIKKGKYASNN